MSAKAGGGVIGMRKKTTSVLALASILAVGGQAAPASAATTTWKVVNPNADGTFSAAAPSLTVKNSAGQSLFACTGGISFGGTMGSKSNTSATVGRFTSGGGAQSCAGDNGSAWTVTPGYIVAQNTFKATGFNASTGTTTLDHSAWTPQSAVWILSSTSAHCAFFVTSAAATYTNSTSVLKTTTAKVHIPPVQDGSVNCPGLLTEGETITFAAEYKVTPAIKITATTS